jgi:polysaccharide export outer membrane protein
VEKLATGAPADDPIVRNGDKIYVPTLENQVFYISGQVRSPGAYPAQTGMTFRTAIARGGGLTEMGSEKKVKVVRNGVEMKSVKLEDKVMPGDVITIGERLF